MKKMKQLLVVLLLVVMCFTLTACKKDAGAPEVPATDVPVATDAPATDAPAADAADAPAAAVGNPDDVMATVNGKNVLRSEVDGYFADMQQFYADYGYDTTSAEMVTLLSSFALETAVEYELMDQQIEKQGLALTAEEREDAAQEARENWELLLADGLSYYGITDASTEEERAATLVTVLAELEAGGITETSYIEESILMSGYDKLQNEIIKDVAVTDEEVKAHYNELVEADRVAYENDAGSYEMMNYYNNMYLAYGMSDYYVDIYYKPTGYRAVTHILLEVDEALMTAYTDLQAAYEEQQDAETAPENPVTEEQIEAARLAIIASVQPTLDEINAQLAAGTAFNDLIPQYSADPGMQDEAAIAAGYEVHMDSVTWDPVFTAAAFSVENVGDVSEPVVGSYGVHVVCYDHDVEGGPVALTDDMAELLRTQLLTSRQSETFYAAIDQWQSEAQIVYSDEAAAIKAAAEALQ